MSLLFLHCLFVISFFLSCFSFNLFPFLSENVYFLLGSIYLEFFKASFYLLGYFLPQTFFRFFCCSTPTKSQSEIALSPPEVFAVLLFLVWTGLEKEMSMT